MPEEVQVKVPTMDPLIEPPMLPPLMFPDIWQDMLPVKEPFMVPFIPEDWHDIVAVIFPMLPPVELLPTPPLPEPPVPLQPIMPQSDPLPLPIVVPAEGMGMWPLSPKAAIPPTVAIAMITTPNPIPFPPIKPAIPTATGAAIRCTLSTLRSGGLTLFW